MNVDGFDVVAVRGATAGGGRGGRHGRRRFILGFGGCKPASGRLLWTFDKDLAGDGVERLSFGEKRMCGGERSNGA